MKDTELNIKIHANTKEALANIKRLESQIKGFSRTTKTSSSSIEGFTKRLTQMAHVYVGFEALKTSISKVLDVGMEFEKSIDKLGAISKASADELEAMKQKAKELGATTQYSASQVVDAMNYQAMAGMKSNEILTATKDILNLATVGSMDLARASDIATDSMSGFGLGADDLGRVVDVMATTVTNSNTDVEQLGEAFKNVAPVSKNLNVSLEETSAMLGTLANAGRKSGEAGTHLKIILQRLASTSKPVVEALDSIGLSAYDSDGKLKPLDSTLKDIKSKLKNLSEQKRNKILKDLFGEEAISSASIILDNLGSMDELLKKVGDSAGKASEMAKDMTDNLDNDVKNLKSALDGLANTIYEYVLPALRDITQNLTEVVRYLDENSEEFIKWGRIIVEVVAEVYLLRKALLALSLMQTAGGITSLGGAFVGLASKAKGAVTALMALAKANRVLLGLSVVIAGVTYKLNELEAETEKLNHSTDKFNTSSSSTESIYKELNSTLDKSIDKYKMTKEEYDKLGETIGAHLLALEDEIKKRKEASDGTREQKDKIFQLERQQKALIESYVAVSDKLSIVTDNTDDATTATKNLSLAEKTHIEELQKAKQKEKEELNKTYTSRVEQHESMILSLENKETDLTNKIVSINQDLQNKLKSIEDQRVHNNESIENQINNLKASSVGKYEEYTNQKLQAEQNLSKAKEALTNGDLENYKHYINNYKSLITSISSKEIEENGKVRVSKEQSTQYAINSLENLKGLENSYYAQKKAEEVTLHNQKITQLQAQLQATKAQLEMEVQRLQIEKQIVEATTGKSFNIDVSGALASIKKIDTQIDTLAKQIKKHKAIDIDTTSAKSSIEEVQTTYGNLTLNDLTLKVKSNTTPADYGIEKLITKRDGEHITLEINPEYEKAQQKIESAIKNFEAKPVETKVDANTQKADAKVSKLSRDIEKSKTTKVNADTQKAIQKLNELREKIAKPSIHKIDVDAKNVLRVISKLQQNTSSTHTIFVKEVHTKATGGAIPLKLATGGEANFERKSGRIAGYDPTDSDDVPALLTRGEFVIKRDAVKHYGDDFLYKLNSMNLPKYATGGMVLDGGSISYKIDSYDISELVLRLKELKDVFKESRDKKRLEQVESKLELLKSKDKEFQNVYDNYDGSVYSKHIKLNSIVEEINSNKTTALSLARESEKEVDNSREYREDIDEKLEDNDVDIKDLYKIDKTLKDYKRTLNFNKVKEYSEKVDLALEKLSKIVDVKDGIEKKLNFSEIELPKKIEKNYDLKRLEKFYKTIKAYLSTQTNLNINSNNTN